MPMLWRVFYSAVHAKETMKRFTFYREIINKMQFLFFETPNGVKLVCSSAGDIFVYTLLEQNLAKRIREF